MTRRVAIVGYTRHKFASSRTDLKNDQLMREATEDVLAQTGLKYNQPHGQGIDAAAIITDDVLEGQTLSETKYQDVIGGNFNDNVKISQDGIQAVAMGLASIMSGHCDTFLVAGMVKESALASRFAPTGYGVEAIFLRPTGLDYLSAAALQARCYMHRYGLSREQFAEVVVKSRSNAAKNPVALETAPVTVGDVINSPLLADPISELDTYAVSDASIALVLAVEEKARKLTDKPVWITGLGTSREVHHPGSRDLAECDALAAAAKRAYKMAGIDDPKKDINVIELTGPFSFQELLWSEGLGLCDKGYGASLLESGKTRIDGPIPVNPSGGVLPGVPTMLHGLSRVIEAAVQLRGEAGDYQVEGARTALAHGTSGPCGQLQAVMTLGI